MARDSAPGFQVAVVESGSDAAEPRWRELVELLLEAGSLQ